MPKILFIAIHRPGRSPSQRFRFEQYLTFLQQKGWQYDFSNLISARNDKIFYQKGHVIKKAFIFFKSIIIRCNDLLRASKYDVIFIQREAFFTGTTFFERRLAKSSAKVIFDFDDAIWLPNVSSANKKLEWLKDGEKARKIIAVSDLVIGGNQFLVDYALAFNRNSIVIPTTIDFKHHQIKNVKPSGKISIGWTGTATTLPYLEAILPLLVQLKLKYKEAIDFKIIVDVDKTYASLNASTTPWNRANEIEELNKIDIGIMPLPDNQWTQGKCGFKGLQYMSLGIPTIMSPVGVNTEIIEEGVNGFLANSAEEWITKISQLIDSKELRTTIGEEGRKTVKDKYSVEANKQKYLDAFNGV